MGRVRKGRGGKGKMTKERKRVGGEKKGDGRVIKGRNVHLKG